MRGNEQSQKNMGHYEESQQEYQKQKREKCSCLLAFVVVLEAWLGIWHTKLKEPQSTIIYTMNHSVGRSGWR